jgi:hypothetical protein
METIILPIEYENVMLTFKGSFYVPDKYYGKWEIQTRTKRAFYHKSDGYYNSKNEWIRTPDGYFSVPPEWRRFNGALLPHGWGGHRVRPEEVIEWRHLNERESSADEA